MTKESILLKYLDVFSFNLRALTSKTGDTKVISRYWVDWRCINNGQYIEITQELTKEEYDFLYDELLKELSPTI